MLYKWFDFDIFSINMTSHLRYTDTIKIFYNKLGLSWAKLSLSWGLGRMI